MKGIEIDGQKIDIRAASGGDYNAETSIFIKQLPEGNTDQDIITLFSQFGIILAATVSTVYKAHFTQVPFD